VTVGVREGVEVGVVVGLGASGGDFFLIRILLGVTVVPLYCNSAVRSYLAGGSVAIPNVTTE